MEINQDILMQYGLMSKLSTGNSLLDALLVMLVPVLVNQILPHIHAFLQRLRERRCPAPAEPYERIITHKQSAARPYFFSDSDSDTEAPKHKLQQAILVHLNSLPNLFEQLETADVQLCRGGRGTPRGSSPGSGYDDEGTDDDASSSSWWYPGIELEAFEVALVPPLDVWIQVEPGLQLKRSEWSDTTTDKEQLVTTRFTLQGQRAQQVDDFIKGAFDSYKRKLKAEQTREGRHDRYLYLPVSLGGDSNADGNADHITYRRYKLSDDKSFANLFHPEKEAIISLVDSFVNNTGKFAIPGFPKKLGFLLHGPPGTGKTSLLKVLAAHTQRSIISIPLSRIATNQQLMDFMYEERVKVEGLEMRVPLPFNKVLYVMEDVDAASHVVRRRDAPDPLAVVMASLRQQQAQPGGLVEVAGPAKAAARSTVAACSSKLPASGGDELNLAGLLNVLDGVVDTPGRMVVLTTNHPEALDPALIRPGRINKQIYLGLLAAPEALQMVRHWFGGQLQQQQEQQLMAAWQDGVVSPAALEALCAECESVELLLEAVQKLVAAAAAAATTAAAANQSSSQQQQQDGQHQQQQKPHSCGSRSSSSTVMIRAASCSASFVEFSSSSNSSSSSSNPSPFSSFCNG